MASFCFLPVHDCAIALRGTGTGEPVVLLHSSASSSSQWRRVAASLGHDVRLAMPDFPGYGDSASWPGHAARSLDTDAAIVAAISEHVGGPVHLVGHSYGGAVALRAARRHPEAVRSLCVIEPVAFDLLDESTDQAELGEIRAIARMVWNGVLRGDHTAAMARFVDYWNGAGTWQRLADDKRRTLAAVAPSIAQEFCAVFAGGTTPAALSEIDVPATVIAGVLSPWPARRVAETVAAALPQAWHHVVSGAGHMVPLTHPDETAAVLRAHLDRAAAPAARAAA